MSNSAINIGSLKVSVSDLDTGTDGELITWDSSGNPATVSTGTAGHILTSNGAGAAPTFQANAGSGGAWEFIATASPSTVAAVDFTDLSSSYFAYCFSFIYMHPATDGVDLYMRTSTNNGSSFDSGASDYVSGLSELNNISYSPQADATAAFMEIGHSLGNASTPESSYGNIFLYTQPGSLYPTIIGHLFNVNGTAINNCVIGGMRLSTTAADAVRFQFSSGNISAAFIKVYGLTNS